MSNTAELGLPISGKFSTERWHMESRQWSISSGLPRTGKFAVEKVAWLNLSDQIRPINMGNLVIEGAW